MFCVFRAHFIAALNSNPKEGHMKRLLTVVCLAAGITTANDARSQTTRKNTTPAAKALALKDVAVVGCLERGSRPGSFGLTVMGMGSQPSGEVPDPRAVAMLPPGTQADLIGMEKGPLESYLGQQVEVAGMILPQRGRAPGAADARISVLYIREISETCAASATPTPAPAPAPASSTGTTAGLAQTGITGNASLTWTSPVISYSRPDGQPMTFAMPASALASPTVAAPIAGATATPTTGATPTPMAGATATPMAAATATPITAATATPMTASAATPGQAPAPATMTGSVPTAIPGPVQTGDPSFAQQGATNTTGTTSELTQTGISGDALLSGLVNVNVQQVLASVQLTANLNVQDVIVNVSDVLNDNQIQALVQALNTNPQASMNASDLTSALQQAGALDPSQWVVGVTGSEIYSNRDLTNALQSRGIIQPGEVIVGHAGPRVFVAGGQ
jgi:hypothetical protein